MLTLFSVYLFDFLKRLRNREKNPDVSTTGILGSLCVTTRPESVLLGGINGLTVGGSKLGASSGLLVGAGTSVLTKGIVDRLDVPVSTAETPFGQMTGFALGN